MLDGANVEIREHVGSENVFIFGLTAHDVLERRKSRFCGADAVAQSSTLERIVASIVSGEFSDGETERFEVLVKALLNYDHFMVDADFDAYWQTHRVLRRTSILNTARMAWFSSDRAIQQYADEIWRVDAANEGC
jgi:glycogen phosphorylase